MAMGSDDEEERALLAGGSSRCEWHPATVACLLDSYGVKCAHIKGYLKIKDWEDIVRDVNGHEYYEGAAPKTMKQCRDKVENLKRRYKLEKRRYDARGPCAVTWSFFPKLDHIMTALNKTGTPGHSGDDVDAEMGQSQSYEGMDCELPEGFAGESMPPLPLPLPEGFVMSVFGDKVKPLDCSLDDILNTVVYNRVSSKLDFEDSSSPEKKPPKRKKPSSNSSSSPFSKKRRESKPAVESSGGNPVQALADALVGFSEVYARIEIAKMEMFTKLVLELAKILSKRRKKSDVASSPGDPK